MNTSKRISNPSGQGSASLRWTQRLLRCLPLFAYTALVIVGAVTPASKIPEILARFNDKSIHGTEFFNLFWFAVFAAGPGTKNRRLKFALLYCAALGVITEGLQYFVPSRSMDIMDFLADAAGFCSAALVFHFIFKMRKGGSLGLF